MKIAVPGAGMVGSAIAGDLANEYEVTAFDINTGSLHRLKQKYPSVNIVTADLQDIIPIMAGWAVLILL